MQKLREKRPNIYKDYYHRNWNKIKLKRDKYSILAQIIGSHEHIIKLLCCVRKRAKANGVTFHLTPKDVIIPAFCPVLGLELNRDSCSPNCATIDRIFPSKGYVKGNIIVISNLANRIKSDATSAQIRSVADFYDRLNHD